MQYPDEPDAIKIMCIVFWKKSIKLSQKTHINKSEEICCSKFIEIRFIRNIREWHPWMKPLRSEKKMWAICIKWATERMIWIWEQWKIMLLSKAESLDFSSIVNQQDIFRSANVEFFPKCFLSRLKHSAS